MRSSMFRPALATFIAVRSAGTVGLAVVDVRHGGTGAADDFFCFTDMKLGTLVSSEKKGIAIDDMTLRNCSHAMISHWPNTYGHREMPSSPVRTARIFKVWTPEWPAEERWRAWKSMLRYIKGNNMTVLIGTSIGCSEDFDRKTWEWTKEFMRLLGRKYIMGLAIGNELEMFHRFREELSVTDECLQKLWARDYAFDWFQLVVNEMDNIGMGFGSIPVTSVFGGLALAGNNTPFIDTPEAAVNTFLSQVVKTYGVRFVFTFNFYPYFDPNLEFDNGTVDHCTSALANALNWEHDGNVPIVTAVARRKMTELTGNPAWRMWLGETGWSSPLAPSLISCMKDCKQFSSIAVFREFYKGFLAWDLSISNATHPLEPPEHVFYFTIRDSSVFGVPEYFGLIPTCGDADCKLTMKSASGGPTAEDVMALAKQMKWAGKASIESESIGSLAVRFPGHLFSILEALRLSKRTYYEAMYLPGEDSYSVNRGALSRWKSLSIVGAPLGALGAFTVGVVLYMQRGKTTKARNARSAGKNRVNQENRELPLSPTAAAAAAPSPACAVEQTPLQRPLATVAPGSPYTFAAPMIAQQRWPTPMHATAPAAQQPQLFYRQQLLLTQQQPLLRSDVQAEPVASSSINGRDSLTCGRTHHMAVVVG